jgi:hypothetical protein
LTLCGKVWRGARGHASVEAMRTASFALALVAALNVATQAPLAYAAPPSGGVQPVPYNPSQPVPVGQPAAPGVVPAPAMGNPAAASTGGDMIVLKGGGMIRGRLVEVIPNDHATIALSTGQTAIVEWSRIDRIEQQAAPNVVVQGAPAPSPVPSGKVWVHIEADRDLALEARTPDSGWGVLCNAPCDQEVPLNADFRISGSGTRTSHAFKIIAQPGQHVAISVNPGSSGGFVLGIVMLGVSPAVIFIGFIVWAVGAIESSTTDIVTGQKGNGSGAETVGGVMMLVGLGALIGGIILVVSNSSTKQTQEIMQPGAPPPRRDDAWLRMPMWHEGAGFERSVPRPQTIPLFSRSF